jgi:hypothetical protein
MVRHAKFLSVTSGPTCPELSRRPLIISAITEARQLNLGISTVSPKWYPWVRQIVTREDKIDAGFSGSA